MQREFSKVLKKAYLKKPIDRVKFEIFLQKLDEFKNSINPIETEEYNKNLITKFLSFEYDEVNTYERVDLAIYKNKKIEVIIEVKRPSNKSEMISKNSFYKKAFFEAVLYFLRESVKNKNHYIKHIIITNLYEWYIFDSVDFNKIISDKLKKIYIDFEVTPKLFKNTTKEFYEIIKSNLPKNLEEKLDFVYIDINKKYTQNQLKQIYKILKKEHLLKEFISVDANKLNKNFYYELLYILGLKEVKKQGKKVLIKSDVKGTILDNIYIKLKTECDISEDKIFEIALSLAITWLNRILFLKLFEARLLKIDKNFKKFLDYEEINEFDALNTLFFEVLAIKEEERVLQNQFFTQIPYINSSLFEVSDIEKKYLRISNLKDNLTLKVYSKSVLNEKELNTLEYLLKFLNSYDFGSDESEEFKSDRLINSAVLGLIFEKLNGYKDGSFYTPSFITSYITKTLLRKKIIDEFNKEFNLEIKDYEELKRYSEANFYKSEFLKKANGIINNLKIVDPAVGSGHFLVSALNEIIVIKNELNLFLREIEIINENDELYFLNKDGSVFEYQKNSNSKVLQIEKSIFNEKKRIIENQLFGVDINPNSAKITRLRLWIELLKNSYFENNKLVTLPNIDINIKVGNSLISKFESINNNIKNQIQEYKRLVKEYKEINEKELKKEINSKIKNIKKMLNNFLIKETKEYKKLTELLALYKNIASEEELLSLDNELIVMALKSNASYQANLFEKVNKNKILKEIKEVYAKLKSKNIETFEWRIEFPEVLDDDGNFLGFDIVLGNPPYIRQEEIKELKEHLKKYKVFDATADIYVYFYELGMNILNEKGVLGYITSNKFFRAKYGKNLREFLKEYIFLINDFNGVRVFDEATVDTAIVLAQKQKADKLIYMKNFKDEIAIDKKILKDAYIFLTPKELKIKKQIEKIGTPLKEWDISINYGIKTGFNEAFIIDEEKRRELIELDPKSEELIKPLLRGRDIKRYGYEWKGLYLINTHNNPPVEIEKYPAIKEHLDKYYDKLAKRSDKGISPYHLRNCAYLKEFEREKIVWAEMSNTNKFAWDDNNFYINQTCYFIENSSKYLLAFLNSKAIDFYMHIIASSLGEGAIRWIKQFVEQLPIPKPETIDKSLKEKLTSLVDKIIKLKKENTDTSDLEEEIDKIVCKIYGVDFKL